MRTTRYTQFPPSGKTRRAGPDTRDAREHPIPTPPFVDTHVHFWDHSVEGLAWSWLDPDFEHPRVRSLHEYDAPRFSVPELRAETEGAGVSRIVHVQAARWNGHPDQETAWLQRLGDEEGWPDAIVGNCRLARTDAAAQVESQARHPRFRGVRDLAATVQLDHPELARNLAVLRRHDAVLELLVSLERFEALAGLARAEPEVTFVVDHAGLPVERTPEYHERWTRAMRELARLDNVVCKVSALAGALDPEWTVDSLAPWVQGCVEAFGPQRCMFGSNWPIDKPYGTYTKLVDAYRELARAYTPDEQRALLSGTAERVYRL